MMQLTDFFNQKKKKNYKFNAKEIEERNNQKQRSSATASIAPVITDPSSANNSSSYYLGGLDTWGEDVMIADHDNWSNFGGLNGVTESFPSASATNGGSSGILSGNNVIASNGLQGIKGQFIDENFLNSRISLLTSAEKKKQDRAAAAAANGTTNIWLRAAEKQNKLESSNSDGIQLAHEKNVNGEVLLSNVKNGNETPKKEETNNSMLWKPKHLRNLEEKEKQKKELAMPDLLSSLNIYNEHSKNIRRQVSPPTSSRTVTAPTNAVSTGSASSSSKSGSTGSGYGSPVERRKGIRTEDKKRNEDNDSLTSEDRISLREIQTYYASLLTCPNPRNRLVGDNCINVAGEGQNDTDVSVDNLTTVTSSSDSPSSVVSSATILLQRPTNNVQIIDEDILKEKYKLRQRRPRTKFPPNFFVLCT